MEYSLIWKGQATPAGRRICALRARGLPTSASGSTGWPTPDHSPRGEIKDEAKLMERVEASSLHGDGKRTLNLQDAAQLSGWPTPTAGEAVHNYRDNHDRNKTLTGIVKDLAGWPTPMAGNPGTEEYNPAGSTDGSRKTVELVGWGTPSARDGKDAGPAFEANPEIVPVESRLARQATLTGWATPAATDGSKAPPDHHGRNLTPVGQALASGPPSTSSPAGTARRGVLNPAFSLWLMGYPAEWVCCGVRAMQSSRKSRRRSSGRTSKRGKK
jgi:hypothetical protein